jgi:hypothetical protein
VSAPAARACGVRRAGAGPRGRRARRAGVRPGAGGRAAALPGADVPVRVVGAAGVADRVQPHDVVRVQGDVDDAQVVAQLVTRAGTPVSPAPLAPRGPGPAPASRAAGVVPLDEYFNFPGWEQHEHKAFTEFIERTGHGFEYLAYNSLHEQVLVRLTS